MLLFFASPKKSNQKKGDACAAGGPQRTASGFWLWRVAAPIFPQAAPDGARASHERAPTLRSVPAAVVWCGRCAAARVGAFGECYTHV
ncbi:MAG: hypothetical protein K2I87_06355 [Bacteroidales bacterium]|nr:hypothetical protein [Bacteroidales bacterium]